MIDLILSPSIFWGKFSLYGKIYTLKFSLTETNVWCQDKKKEKIVCSSNNKTQKLNWAQSTHISSIHRTYTQ